MQTTTIRNPLSWINIVRRSPSIIYNRASIFATNSKFRRKREVWLGQLTSCSPNEVRRYILEIEQDTIFLQAIRHTYGQHIAYFPLPTDFMTTASGSTMFFHCISLYAFIRLVQPEIVIETGGTPGKSSAFILQAMQRNNKGFLFTIDLPPPETGTTVHMKQMYRMRPKGVTSNWLVPANLRNRQQLLTGASYHYLPRLLQQVKHLDVFIHDSDHSYDNMMWEFRTVHSYLRHGGFLWSDDILTNTAWFDFCAEAGLTSYTCTSQGTAHKGF